MNKHKQMLEKAQCAVEKNRELVRQYAKKRQWYHFMPECGWMNDPNGLVFFKGKYHLFYQHYPYGPYWSAMHWGHAVSTDLLHWEYLPIALAPSEPYDDYQKGGIYSGGAVVGDDGKLYLFYTGTLVKEGKVIKSQCVAFSEDGVNFEKCIGNPVVPPTDLVESDPKVWKYKDKWYMIVGGELDKKGRAILYVSDNLTKWELFGTILESDGSLGAMWECPDLFHVDGYDILVIGPMHLNEQKCTYLVGNMDYENCRFEPEITGEVDFGFDYYAPQSFEASQGRRLQFAWANAWDWMPWWKGFGTTAQEGWCGSLNIPREVHVVNGKPTFTPVEELKSLRYNHRDYGSLHINEQRRVSIEAGDGVHFELLAKLSLQNTTAQQVVFQMRCGEQIQGCNDRHTDFIFDLKEKRLTVDRNYSDDWSVGTKYCDIDLNDASDLIIHFYSDTVSIELFTEKYQKAFSLNIYPEEVCNKIYLSAQKGEATFISLETWGLKQVCI